MDFLMPETEIMLSLKLYSGSGKFRGRLASKDLEVFKTQRLEAREPDQISPGNQSLRFWKKTTSRNCDPFLSLGSIFLFPSLLSVSSL